MYVKLWQFVFSLFVWESPFQSPSVHKKREKLEMMMIILRLRKGGSSLWSRNAPHVPHMHFKVISKREPDGSSTKDTLHSRDWLFNVLIICAGINVDIMHNLFRNKVFLNCAIVCLIRELEFISQAVCSETRKRVDMWHKKGDKREISLINQRPFFPKISLWKEPKKWSHSSCNDVHFFISHSLSCNAVSQSVSKRGQRRSRWGRCKDVMVAHLLLSTDFLLSKYHPCITKEKTTTVVGKVNGVRVLVAPALAPVSVLKCQTQVYLVKGIDIAYAKTL